MKLVKSYILCAKNINKQCAFIIFVHDTQVVNVMFTVQFHYS